MLKTLVALWIGTIISFVPLEWQTNILNRQLAYVKYVNRTQSDICIITIDSLNENCISNMLKEKKNNLTWSLDGLSLAFENEETPPSQPYEHNRVVYIHNLDDNTTKAVTPQEWKSSLWGWSPDGKNLLVSAFQSREDDSEVYIIDSVSGDITPLTVNDVSDQYASWSPDGTQIVYLSGYPDANLIVMNADGSSAKALTEGLKISLEVQPQWSPDGTQIAFVVNGKRVGTSPTSEVYLINADGSGLRQLTETGGATFDPRWSPDGQQLLFFGFAVGAFDRDATGSLQTEVFRINADGSNLINLTQNVGLDYQPTWSPDGEWIAFTSSRIWESENGRSGIFIMRPDGSDLQMLTNEPPLIEGGSSFNNPIWRPE